MKNRTKLLVGLCCMAGVLSMTGCGTKTNEEPEKQEVSDTQEQDSSEDVTASETPDYGTKIEDQSFDTEIAPIGQVTFTAYAPEKDSNDDVTFVITKVDGKDIVLDGTNADNTLEGQQFNQVEAVSFKDYNQDGYTDIIAICNYSTQSTDSAAASFSRSRIYSGSDVGTFTLESQLSEEADSALSELSVDGIMSFLGAGQNTQSPEDDMWKMAYSDYFTLHSEYDSTYVGYTEIYVNDDNVPEIVAVGNCEAAGCLVLNYYQDQVRETQIGRLGGLSYIEKANRLLNSNGNMDEYYDVIYGIEDDGLMKETARGEYGAADNSNVQVDANGTPIYQYFWNGSQVDEASYQQTLAGLFDQSKAQPAYTDGQLMSRTDLIAKMQGK